MKRFLYVACIFIFLLTLTVSAEPLNIAAELSNAQSLQNMQTGIYAISEEVLNTYFADIAANNPKVKNATIAILKNNKIILTTTIEKTGTIRLICTIKEFYFDKDNALLKMHIDKKELLGSSITSWFMNQMSLGFITDLYGNPLAQANINSKVNGNTIDIDLKPFATSLFTTGIGQTIGDQLIISNVTTEDKILYLHTNLAVTLLK
ncbi:hypothetical protein [Sporomusa sp. KB1]|uniref:hypothetical protein n=1 Tax=Sporomusa sp. KB1 TaxID=943346 RepID=UPI0011A62587|nr:hypothetical protein [Sporomusa sp. KB1]TWH46462.1 hypothetical protein Salpa_2453 [Sporomusa sp. KB1]